MDMLPKSLSTITTNLVADEFRDWAKSGPVTGVAICAGPFEMEMVLDFTGLRGSGSNIYYSLIFQLPKWDYHIKKVDEWIEVTPTWAEYYNITIGQKQKLEASIKQGLTSAAQAVADYELLEHDLRRYREVLDYFVAAKKNKDEHVLRSLFVDRVDAHTGEGYSMITMAKRWPTIITDFIRMKSEWNNRETIRTELDVSAAEATVLLTKNHLYREWKELFLPTVRDRVARLQVSVASRRKSVDEYKSWLKPYVARYKMIREKTELSPKQHYTDPFLTPGFGQSQAMTGIRLWFWKPYAPPEKGKPESIPEKRRRGFLVDPYDNLVRKYKKKIEERYSVTISDNEVDNVLKDAVRKATGANPAMDPTVLYYVFFDCKIQLGFIRTPPPEGMETDNLMFTPIKAYVLSQNALLIHMLELYAREKVFEREINTLIGSREIEEEYREKIEEEFNPRPPAKGKRFAHLITLKGKLIPPLDSFFHLFVKRGPYEPIFKERVSKMYARGSGGYYGQISSLIMKEMQVK